MPATFGGNAAEQSELKGRAGQLPCLLLKSPVGFEIRKRDTVSSPNQPRHSCTRGPTTFRLSSRPSSELIDKSDRGRSLGRANVPDEPSKVRSGSPYSGGASADPVLTQGAARMTRRFQG